MENCVCNTFLYDKNIYFYFVSKYFRLHVWILNKREFFVVVFFCGPMHKRNKFHHIIAINIQIHIILAMSGVISHFINCQKMKLTLTSEIHRCRKEETEKKSIAKETLKRTVEKSR